MLLVDQIRRWWPAIERGRPAEIDQLNGEIIRLGQKSGMPTLVNYLRPRQLCDASSAQKRCKIGKMLSGCGFCARIGWV
jgi:hypothetical protein